MSLASIPILETLFLSSASPGHAARLFEWRGELYRAVRPDRTEFFRDLIRRGVIESLVSGGLLVETEPASLRLGEHDLIFRHRRLPFVTYPFEWSGQALRDAALKFLELNQALARHGLATSDTHTWNTLFDGAKPVFVDLGSLAPLASIRAESWLAQFDHWFVEPLRLMRNGQHRVARALMTDPTAPIRPEDTGRPIHPLAARSLRLTRRIMNRFSRRTPTWEQQLEAAADRVRAIKLPTRQTEWSGYYEPSFPRLDSPGDWDDKQRSVAQALAQLRPRTVHDLAGNRGWYARLAALMGSAVVCTDIDETCLDHVHREASSSGEPITAAYLNLRHPAPALGWSNRLFPAATTRLRCDCVLALAIVHHMVFKAMADFPIVLDALSALTRRDLIVEFVSREDRFVKQWWTPGHEWYTLDHLAEQARRRFGAVRVIPSHPAGRSLLVCEGVRQPQTRQAAA